MLFLAAFVLLFLFAAWELWGRRERRLRHGRTLRNIDRLEHELFPHLFPSGPEQFSFAPGAIWTLNDASAVQIVNFKRDLQRTLLFGR